MRKLMWLTIGFAAGCGYCAYFRPVSLVIPLILLGFGLLFLVRYSPLPTRMEFLCLGACLGLIWFWFFQNQYLDPALSADGTDVHQTVTITDYSWESEFGVTADGTILLDGKAYPIRLYLKEQEYLSPGDTVTGNFQLRYTPGGEDAATFHAGRGIFLLGYQRGDVDRRAGDSSGIGYSGPRLARWIQSRLQILLPEDVYPFAKALLLGDGSELSYEVDTALKISGIRHIIAVSGLHVMLLYTLIHQITLKNKWLTAFICIPVLAVFTAAAGFTPSVTRASCMVTLMILARLFNRDYDPTTALSFSVLMMLIWNPIVITAVSFQMTVGCVAGMQLFSGPIRIWSEKTGTNRKTSVGRIRQWIWNSASVTLGAMSLTVPFGAVYFGTVSLVGVLANMVTLWAVNLAFNGLVLAVLLSLVSFNSAVWIAEGIGWVIRYIVRVAQWLSGIPCAAVYTVDPYIVLWLVFVMVLVITFLLSFHRRPGVLLCCGLIGLVLAVSASRMEFMQDDIRVTMLDVGQGQSILLQNRGYTYLVDCGGSSDTDTADLISRTLFSQGTDTVDGLILTHWDRDHSGALPYLESQISIREVYSPEMEETGKDVIRVKEKCEIPVMNGKITIFPGDFPEDPQENGLCVLFETENCAILITGDRSELGEVQLLESYVLPKVDLLVAGHHGSKYSTSQRLLEAVQPDQVWISAGKDNGYGHPAQELLDRLAAYGCRIYRTDLQGTLIFRR